MTPTVPPVEKANPAQARISGSFGISNRADFSSASKENISWPLRPIFHRVRDKDAEATCPRGTNRWRARKSSNSLRGTVEGTARASTGVISPDRSSAIGSPTTAGMFSVTAGTLRPLITTSPSSSNSPNVPATSGEAVVYRGFGGSPGCMGAGVVAADEQLLESQPDCVVGRETAGNYWPSKRGVVGADGRQSPAVSPGHAVSTRGRANRRTAAVPRGVTAPGGRAVRPGRGEFCELLQGCPHSGGNAEEAL